MDRGSIILTGGLVIGLITAAVVVLCIVLAKKQKSANISYQKTSAAERNILESDSLHVDQVVKTPQFTALITRFPEFPPGKQKIYPGNVVLTQNWIRMIHINGVVQHTYVKNNAFQFVTRQVVWDDVTYTKASAGKRAVAGAVIAGAAGAAIGAVSAVAKNKQGGIDHHTLTETTNYRVALMANLPSAGGVPVKEYVSCDGILLSNKLMEKLKSSQQVMECIPQINGNYIAMPGIVKDFATQEQAELVAAWLNENLIG